MHVVHVDRELLTRDLGQLRLSHRQRDLGEVLLEQLREEPEAPDLRRGVGREYVVLRGLLGGHRGELVLRDHRGDPLRYDRQHRQHDQRDDEAADPAAWPVGAHYLPFPIISRSASSVAVGSRPKATVAAVESSTNGRCHWYC